MSVYAVSDLHGYLDLYKQIKNFLKPEDIVYFLGDACDRGPQSWETVKAIAADPQFIYIRGNHEQLLANMMEDIIEQKEDITLYKNCMVNGTLATVHEWQKECGLQTGWLKYLNKLPFSETYINTNNKKIILCHAGFTPHRGNNIMLGKDLLWDRKHIKDNYWPEYTDDNMIIVHGHTPVIYHTNIPGAYFYCDGHKIDIDCGTYEFPNYCCLLNLDTFEEHLFEVKD